jgi:hypothetical protein
VNDHEVHQLELLDIDDLLLPSKNLGMSVAHGAQPDPSGGSTATEPSGIVASIAA